MTLSAVILLTLFLGFFPPLLWLWFWLKEAEHPEPKSELALVFSMGMAVVLIAFIAEKSFSNGNETMQTIFGYSKNTFYLLNVLGFAFIEEIAKTCAAFFTALRSKYFNEPMDAMIYVMTASLGFAALENALFISHSASTTLSQTIIVSAFRFANAVLIHASTGAIIGAAFAFSFCNRSKRLIELGTAIAFATLLHAAYNFYILGNGNDNDMGHQFIATGIVGVGAVFALILFERAKRLKVKCA